jgi:hypothetical protein
MANKKLTPEEEKLQKEIEDKAINFLKENIDNNSEKYINEYLKPLQNAVVQFINDSLNEIIDNLEYEIKPEKLVNEKDLIKYLKMYFSDDDLKKFEKHIDFLIFYNYINMFLFHVKAELRKRIYKMFC